MRGYATYLVFRAEKENREREKTREGGKNLCKGSRTFERRGVEDDTPKALVYMCVCVFRSPRGHTHTTSRSRKQPRSLGWRNNGGPKESIRSAGEGYMRRARRYWRDAGIRRESILAKGWSTRVGHACGSNGVPYIARSSAMGSRECARQPGAALHRRESNLEWASLPPSTTGKKGEK